MPEKIKQQLIEEEMKKSYIDYAMSVITARALPDVKDGLKPVHRRILYAMYKSKLFSDKPHRKSAFVNGRVLSSYHPHGDVAVYDALVRLAQDFSMRYPLVDGHGNFGCFTGDTKIKLLDGTSKSFKELCKQYGKNDIFYVYSVDKNGRIVVGEASNPRLTKKKTKIIELTLDNGEKIRCTPDHKFLLRSLKYKKAKDLKKTDALMPGYLKFSQRDLKDYFVIKQVKDDEYEYVHDIVDKYNLEKGVYSLEEGSVRHHQDFNKHNNNPDNIQRISWDDHTKLHYEQISELWKNKEFRKKQGEGIRKYYRENPEAIERARERIIRINKDPKFKKKYVEKKRQEFIEMWRDDDYRKKQIKLISKRNKERLKENPNMMKDMAEEAAKSHKKNWKKKDYKENIIKNKILCYTNYLVNEIGEESINKETYDSNRYNNCFPKFENAIKYFEDINEMISASKEYNHKMISIRQVNQKEDVYDITVKKYHNFLLDAGIFVHNSQDGFPAAASRYTEARLAKISNEMLKNIDENTVNFVPNYDGSTKEPVVLPAVFPNLLVNGSTGIAVGMATNIPPHNLNEAVDAVVASIDNPEISISELIKLMPGPDFPTGGIIAGKGGIRNAYDTGRGKVTVLAKAEIEESKDKKKIVITEIPYMVNKTMLIEEIANLIRDKRVEGISDLRDESDRKGMRIVVELKQGHNAEVILNQLQKYSQLKTTFGIIMIALVNGQPKILNLKEVIGHFIEHRREVTRRRLEFELEKSRLRAHILLGLKVALNNVDAVVQTIKSSRDPIVAKQLLIERFKLSEKQSEAILEMRLQRLTSLETNKLIEEHDTLVKRIKELREVLDSNEKMLNIIKKELIEIKEKYGDERKTELRDDLIILGEEDLIPDENVVVTVTHSGYIKRMPITTYRAQGRGGRGVIGTGTKEEDFVENLFITSTHDYILFFTNSGQLYWLKAYDVPEGSRQSNGKAIVNLLNLKENEKITTTIPDKDYGKGYLLMITKKGLIKKCRLELFSRPRSNGIRCVNLRDKDELISVIATDGYQKLIIGTKNGLGVKFDEIDVRPMGRGATGVKAVRLKANDEVVGMDVSNDNLSLLTLTENGYGKRTELNDYRLIKRGGGGVINIRTSERNGKVIGVKTVDDNDEVFLITSKGIMLRTKIKNISKIGRNTQGVRIIKLNAGDKLKSIAKVVNNGD